jgi:hypothetical protein
MALDFDDSSSFNAVMGYKQSGCQLPTSSLQDDMSRNWKGKIGARVARPDFPIIHAHKRVILKGTSWSIVTPLLANVASPLALQ